MYGSNDLYFDAGGYSLGRDVSLLCMIPGCVVVGWRSRCSVGTGVGNCVSECDLLG